MFLLNRGYELTDAGEETPLAGLQHPALDIGEATEVGMDESLEGLLRSVEAPFDLGGRGAEGRGVLVAGLGSSGKRIPQQRLPADAVRHGPVGSHKGLGLAGGQGISGCHTGQSHLGAAIEGAELQSQRHRKPSVVETESELRGKTSGQCKTAFDPGLFSAEELRDRRRGELVLVGERGHHPGLVHGTRSPPRGIRREDTGLHGNTRYRLLHHGDLFQAFAFPATEPLESVDDLEASIRCPGHPERHGGQVDPRVGILSAERGKGGPQLVDGDEGNEAHRRGTSKGRT
jgi:hypothetical protein